LRIRLVRKALRREDRAGAYNAPLFNDEMFKKGVKRSIGLFLGYFSVRVWHGLALGLDQPLLVSVSHRR